LSTFSSWVLLLFDVALFCPFSSIIHVYLFIHLSQTTEAHKHIHKTYIYIKHTYDERSRLYIYLGNHARTLFCSLFLVSQRHAYSYFYLGHL